MRRNKNAWVMTVSELVLCLALSFVVLFASYDLLKGLDDYLAIREVAEAGAAYASVTPDLERGAFVVRRTGDSSDSKNHGGLHRKLLRALRRVGFAPEALVVSTANEDGKLIRIEITGWYRPQLKLFHGFPISAIATRPYLAGSTQKARDAPADGFQSAPREALSSFSVSPKKGFTQFERAGSKIPILRIFNGVLSVFKIGARTKIPFMELRRTPGTLNSREESVSAFAS